MSSWSLIRQLSQSNIHKIHEMCVSTFPTNFIRTICFFVLRVQQDSSLNAYRSTHNLPFILIRY